jgi:hypothetical protein
MNGRGEGHSQKKSEVSSSGVTSRVHPSPVEGVTGIPFVLEKALAKVTSGRGRFEGIHSG